MVCGKYSPEPIFIPSFPQFSTELGQLSTVSGHKWLFLVLI
jgi:hypothetical protein